MYRGYQHTTCGRQQSHASLLLNHTAGIAPRHIKLMLAVHTIASATWDTCHTRLLRLVVTLVKTQPAKTVQGMSHHTRTSLNSHKTVQYVFARQSSIVSSSSLSSSLLLSPSALSTSTDIFRFRFLPAGTMLLTLPMLKAPAPGVSVSGELVCDAAVDGPVDMARSCSMRLNLNLKK